MSQINCYFISGSPLCWSVMLALAVKQLPYQPRRLNNSKGDQKSETFLAINPRGTVPVLVDGAVTVRETNAILAYLEAAYPDPPLFGTSPAQTAQIWQIVAEAGERLTKPIGNAVRPIFRGRAAEMAEEIGEAMGHIHTELAALEHQLSHSPFLTGPALSAADIAIYPSLMQLMRGAGNESAAGLDLKVAPLARYYPKLAAWTARIEALPGYGAAYPPHWQ